MYKLFGRIASEALGLSDIGKIIDPKDFDKVEADDYVFHEDDEKIFFLIKSKADEYCFTNRALIHVDGKSAISKKRMLRRYEYFLYPIRNVFLETAGTVDLDVEIKFTMGDVPFSIDVDKKQVEKLKDLYKALFKISIITYENKIGLDYANQSIQYAVSSFSGLRAESKDVVQNFKDITDYSFEWLVTNRNKYVVEDFSDVFLKYINN
ncbi:MAG TPA: PH domain-containing protein [Pseudobacteroides sp.]|uniref:PH domain-containing protein n=1 Tax=Pseudobacteroides sp. TaxID=1968840 RepID=UPI002F95711D